MDAKCEQSPGLFQVRVQFKRTECAISTPPKPERIARSSFRTTISFPGRWHTLLPWLRREYHSINVVTLAKDIVGFPFATKLPPRQPSQPDPSVDMGAQSLVNVINNSYNSSRSDAIQNPPYKRRKVDVATDDASQSATSLPKGDQDSFNPRSSPPLVTPVPPIVTKPESPKPQNSVKRERSPTPPISHTPRPVTEGALRFVLPPKCRKSHPDYANNRKKWVAQEVKKLRELKLEITRVFTRDDGMVIDWKSSSPVMSDTLLPAVPEDSAVRAIDVDTKHSTVNRKARPTPVQSEEPTASVIDVDSPEPVPTAIPGSCHVPSPSEASALAIASASVSAPNSFPNLIFPQIVAHFLIRFLTGRETTGSHAAAEECTTTTVTEVIKRVQLETSRRQVPIGASAIRPNTGSNEETVSVCPHSTSTLEGSKSSNVEQRAVIDAALACEAPSKEEIDDMQAAALRFLQSYTLTFESDRAGLASAYSRDATFSIQIYDPCSPTCSSKPCKIKQGRLDIMAELLSLPDDQRLYADIAGMSKVDYDFVHLGQFVGALLMCYATQTINVDGPRRGKWLCDQRFVLKRKEWDEEDRSTEGLWPLVAVSHQMTIRHIPL
ncbi:hypothetical protein A0H81_13572 [Grifola frondosa]|uniref:NTF2 domain-containing protein n=1 Tax=Grifola frondosa TaxID=5627 RepID=A0A1C7LP00_GRIFR|nr:hypothetical protein A0H81_13572 [Grifola frondosa]